MKTIFSLAVGLLAFAVPANAQTSEPALIPRPAEMKLTGGEAILPPERIFCDRQPTQLAQLGAEGYRLDITTAAGARITAATEAGMLYGLNTLAELMSNTKAPCLTITDKPRYTWRGYMLDASRHFAPPAEIKALLDEMCRYKLNRFHWHLTDDEGWRIEIKKYPLLTSIGGVGDKSKPKAPAQFYTQEEIRDIVAYARASFITIVPEIDMPGHASGATRAYPAHAGGGSDRLPNFTFNPGKPETLNFLQDILREVKELFPDCGVIHYGGDEVHFGWGKWDTLPEVQALKAKEKLADKQAVEKWFNRTMGAFINS
ncbi:MAG: family 20 glycosylhydrolase, partial [Kiritimatiellaeota bacterium]|nr:family 20 glycosylhydrolase [Kiritimatiellota bacterium]